MAGGAAAGTAAADDHNGHDVGGGDAGDGGTADDARESRRREVELAVAEALAQRVAVDEGRAVIFLHHVLVYKSGESLQGRIHVIVVQNDSMTLV